MVHTASLTYQYAVIRVIVLNVYVFALYTSYFDNLRQIPETTRKYNVLHD